MVILFAEGGFGRRGCNEVRQRREVEGIGGN
jgi:hypothetical protein